MKYLHIAAVLACVLFLLSACISDLEQSEINNTEGAITQTENFDETETSQETEESTTEKKESEEVAKDSYKIADICFLLIRDDRYRRYKFFGLYIDNKGTLKKFETDNLYREEYHAAVGNFGNREAKMTQYIIDNYDMFQEIGIDTDILINGY